MPSAFLFFMHGASLPVVRSPATLSALVDLVPSVYGQARFDEVLHGDTLVRPTLDADTDLGVL